MCARVWHAVACCPTSTQAASRVPRRPWVGTGAYPWRAAAVGMSILIFVVFFLFFALVGLPLPPPFLLLLCVCMLRVRAVQRWTVFACGVARRPAETREENLRTRRETQSCAEYSQSCAQGTRRETQSCAEYSQSCAQGTTRRSEESQSFSEASQSSRESVYQNRGACCDTCGGLSTCGRLRGEGFQGLRSEGSECASPHPKRPGGHGSRKLFRKHA